MPRKKISYVPGSVFTRKGRDILYIKMFGKQFSTGLKDSVAGRREAERMKEHIYHEYMRSEGMLPKVDKSEYITVKEAFEEFQESLEIKGRAKNTLRSYRLAYDTFIRGNYQLNQKSGSQYRIIHEISSFVKSEKNLADNTINIRLRGIRAFVNFCVKQGYLPPIKFYEDIKRNPKSKEVIPYKDEHLDLVVKEFDKTDREFSLLLLFMRYSGFRIKETLELTWDMVKFDKHLILVPNKINTHIQEPFPISTLLKDILEELQSRANEKIKKQDKVFRWLSSSTSRLSRRLHAVEKIIEDREHIKITENDRAFHRFRSAYGTELMQKAKENNISIFDLKDLMRHKSIDTTINHYKKYDTGNLISKLDAVQGQKEK